MTDTDNLLLNFLHGGLARDEFARLRHWTFSAEAHRQHARRSVELWFTASVMADTAAHDYRAALARFYRRVGIDAGEAGRIDGAMERQCGKQQCGKRQSANRASAIPARHRRESWWWPVSSARIAVRHAAVVAACLWWL